MSEIRILISEGNEISDRNTLIRSVGCSSSGICDRVLKGIRSDIETEIIFASDQDNKPRHSLSYYDGILFTGSMSNIQDMTDGTRRQIAFMSEAFESGTPLFGICWGLQLATVAAGGVVGPSQAADGRGEWPFAHSITLTADGLCHPMHQNRSSTFDSFAFHSDMVLKLPKNATVTAQNGLCVQALQIRGSKSVFWGVQYHPEADGRQALGFTKGFAHALVGAGYFLDANEASSFADLLGRLGPDFLPSEAERERLYPLALAAIDFRPVELINWLEALVIPERRRKRGLVRDLPCTPGDGAKVQLDFQV